MLIIGAKGHAIELLDCLDLGSSQQKGVFFFDDVSPNSPALLYQKFQILHTIAEASCLLREDPAFVLGIGTPIARYKLAHKFQQLKGHLTSVISPSAHIGSFDVTLARGLNIMHQVLISNSTQIGEGTLLNTAASIHHDVKVGAYCEVSPGARLLGGSSIGDFCRIGCNATVLPRVKIGNNVQIGAGAVVIKDVDDHSLVAGVPARTIRVLPPPDWWPSDGPVLVGEK